MTAPRPVTVIGTLGTQLDAGWGPARWERWRPTVALFERDDVPFRTLHLLVPVGHERLADVIAADVRNLVPEIEIHLHPTSIVNPWDFEEVFGTLHDWATARPWSPDDEELWVHITTGTHVQQICLFLLAESRVLPASLVQTAPGRERPPPLQLIDLDLARYDRIATRFAARKTEAAGILKAGIETRNTSFNRMIGQIEHVVVNSTAPILLTGPTGAGKTRLARQIHALRKQRHLVSGPFIEVNCATLRGDAAMSALFGHVRGAFTGAADARPGLLRQADRGVLFLDEIGELGLDEQAMLLRAVEDRRFRPLGGDIEVESHFQLIAGSNRELGEAVIAGRFRDDLLARINLWTFRMPGLAERPEDVEPNLDAELTSLVAQTGRRVRLSREARARFLRFATAPEARWTGNFRDLAAAVTRMATLAPAGNIDEAVVDEEIVRLRNTWGTQTGVDPVAEVLGHSLADELDRFDRVQLADVITACRASDSLSAAGRTLFARSLARRTSVNDADRLRKYLARFGLRWEDVHGTGGLG